MATAGSIIKRAVRLLTTNRTPSTDEQTDGLEALNARLDALRNEKLFCFAMRSEALTLVASTSSYTIGPSGSLNTTRPVAIEDAWITDSSNNSYAVRIITDAEYDAIGVKTTTSNWPNRINYRNTMPTGTLLCYPVPTQASTLNLLTRTPLVAFAATTDSVTLPPGWEELLVAELAIVLAPEYEVQVPQSVLQMSRQAKAGIRVVNSAPFIAATELPFLVGHLPKQNILTDGQ